MKKLFFLLSVFFMQIALAGSPVLSDPVQEKRFDMFTHSLRCLKCEHQSIAESDSDFSKDVKQWLIEAILAGQGDAEIKSMLQERFGDRIFLDPPWQLNTYVLWFLPVLLFGLGCLVWVRKVFFAF